jgi:hypothetical protein
MPFGSSYNGSVTVAVGDVNHDGVDDLITGTATDIARVKVFDGSAIMNGANPNNNLLVQFSPYADQFHVGVNVAAGDISGNGFADIVTGPTAGNPDVRVYNGQDIANHTFSPTGPSLLAQFFPYGLQFNVGANVGAGDVNNNRFADIVTGPTAGNPDVRVYNGRDIANHTFSPRGQSLLAQFFAYGINSNIGAFVTVGDTNGDGFGDIITGPTSGNPEVKVFDGNAIANHLFNPSASLLTHFFAFDLGQNMGVTVGSNDFELTNTFDIVTGNHKTSPNYRVVRGNATGVRPPAVKQIEGFATTINGGTFVGA